jgi:SAM-dependent MidA family methyltransferase
MTASAVRSILPPLSPEEREHSDAVVALIHAELEAASGWISFERFMELALYAPGLGYYSAGALKFGAAGDFITAPELSPLFGQALARQCAPLLHGEDADLVELGAGSGALAATLLPALERLGSLPRRYAILEVSADLRARQRRFDAGRSRKAEITACFEQSHAFFDQRERVVCSRCVTRR